MNNNDDIEILDDFGFDEEPKINNNFDESINQEIIDENNTSEQNNLTNDNNSTDESKNEEIENPVVEMINNKTTMRLILIMLVVLFVAVFLMPKVFELING